MSTLTTNLLRRTAVAFAAVAGLFAAHANAAVVTLNGANGNTCSYSSMSVAPDGSFNVTCTTTTGGGTPTPPPAGSLALTSQADIGIGASVSITAFRSGGSAGTVGVLVTASGNGCTNGSGPLTWVDGETSAKPINVVGIANGTCTIGLSSVSGGASLGSPSSVTFNVGTVVSGGSGGGGGGGLDLSSCPTGYTLPTEMISAQLGGLGNPYLAMGRSNQVVSMPLPATAAGYSTGQVSFSESAGGAYTPQPVTLNISISKCPGLIDTDTNNRCNVVSTNGNYNSITWFSKAYSVISSPATANPRGYCWAGDANTQYYINSKWTYSQCAFGAQVCGFAVQQNLGPF